MASDNWMVNGCCTQKDVIRIRAFVGQDSIEQIFYPFVDPLGPSWANNELTIGTNNATGDSQSEKDAERWMDG